MGKPFDESFKKVAQRMLENGKTVEQVADALGFSRGTIVEHLGNPNRKQRIALSTEQKSEAIADIANGIKAKEFCEKYDVSVAQYYKLKKENISDKGIVEISQTTDEFTRELIGIKFIGSGGSGVFTLKQGLNEIYITREEILNALYMCLKEEREILNNVN